MSMKQTINTWRYPVILLSSIGISSIGSWVYFIALNLLVLKLTGSAVAVSGLYIIRSFSSVFTNLWSGSLVDRCNKKYMMITLNVVQAFLIVILPLFSSVGAIYTIVFLITIASSIYHASSVTYITKLIPVEQRKRFNALRSVLDSGAFLTGPAIAGMLFTIGTPYLSIYLNAAALFLSAFVTIAMPNVEAKTLVEKESKQTKITWHTFLEDWKLVVHFSRKYQYVMLIYFLFSMTIVLMTATDSLEAAFATNILYLTEGQYGMLVSIAGLGVLIGALFNNIVVQKIPTKWLIGVGSIITAFGYLIFTSSYTFLVASIGVLVLSFATSFANTGFYTFYQNNIPVAVMGRVISVYGLVEALCSVIFTAILAIISELLSIRIAVVGGALMMCVVSILLLMYNVKPSKKPNYGQENRVRL